MLTIIGDTQPIDRSAHCVAAAVPLNAVQPFRRPPDSKLQYGDFSNESANSDRRQSVGWTTMQIATPP
jgi:hypothetical protein